MAVEARATSARSCEAGWQRASTPAVAAQTDSYFLKTKAIVGHFGDRPATYAVFMRRPVICAPRLAIEFLETMAAERGQNFKIELNHPEGSWVGAGEPILYVGGSLFHLVDLETVLLQKLGPACVAAYNAYAMCADLPKVAFMAMDARHCAGAEMAEMMAYAAAVGSAVAQRETGAVGFVGCAADATARFFGQERGLGTMPHALIGYAGSTVRAAEMFREVFPDEPMTVLVDYFGHELTDAVAVAGRFPDLAAAAVSPSASIPRGAAIARGSTLPAPMRCSSATRRKRSAATAPRRNCATSSAPGCPRRRFGSCAGAWTRPASRRSRSSRARASGPRNAG